MKDLLHLSIAILFAITAPQASFAQDSSLILSGSVDGYKTRDFDNKLDFGLIIPTLSKKQIMNFNLSSVLSTKTDVIRAAGQSIRVPSNLSLPRQSERYFFTIRINKPSFRLPIHIDIVPEQVAVLEGHMPFQSTVDTLRGGSPLFSVINSFTFKSFTLGPATGLSSELQFTAGENKIEAEGVLFSVPSKPDRDYISLGLNLSSTFDEDGTSTYFPINIKTLERPQRLMSFGEETIPTIVTIPKSTFESTGEESKNKAFPFTLVWNDPNPIASLPLGREFVEIVPSDTLFSFTVDNSKFEGFKIIGYKVTTYDGGLNIITEDVFSQLEGLDLENKLDIKRLRVDVLAVDPDPVLNSITAEAMTEDDIFEQAKYITRYEKDFK